MNHDSTTHDNLASRRCDSRMTLRPSLYTLQQSRDRPRIPISHIIGTDSDRIDVGIDQHVHHGKQARDTGQATFWCKGIRRHRRIWLDAREMSHEEKDDLTGYE